MVRRPIPGLYRADNGLRLVMAHGSLYLTLPEWMGRIVWRWRQRFRARRNEPLTFPDVAGLPTNRDALRSLLGRAYREHNEWRRQFEYKGVKVIKDYEADRAKLL